MKNSHFYIGLSVLNIILAICVFATCVLGFITLFISSNWIIPLTVLCLLILFKIFFLYIFFKIVEKYFPKSILNQIAKELKENIKRKESALTLAFGYDLIMLLVFTLISHEPFYIIIHVFFAYLMISLFGICGFYLALFFIWEIQMHKAN